MKKMNLILLTLFLILISCATAVDKKLYKKDFQACTKFFDKVLCGQYSFKKMRFSSKPETSNIDINGAMIFPKEVWLKELKPVLSDSVRFDLDSIK